MTTTEKASTRDTYAKGDEKLAKSAVGTEAQKKSGIEPARRQAEGDWEDSAKESGD